MTNEECVKILQQVKDGDLLTFDKDRRKALDMAIEMMGNSPTQMTGTSDPISRQDAIDALSHMCSEDENGITVSRANVNSMLRALPSAQPTLYGYSVEHLILIARALQKENLTPERVAEALTDIGRVVAIVRDEFFDNLRKAVENVGFDKQTGFD